MKKRVLSMFMVLALCLTLLPAPVRAAEDTPESGAIVQQEQQEEISPAVSEQAGTNEEENGSEGDPQNTGTPDAGGAEDSKADAPESGEDENAGNNADAAVSAVQTMIDALPIVSELDGMTADELDAAYDDIQAAYDAYEALNAEQQAQITGADFEALLGWFNSQTALLADAQSGEHTHCVCGKDSGTTVNGHTHNNSTAWTAADSLPGTAGSYYLTQSVSSDWTVPTGEVNLCLNGQTINGKITVGSGATLTLTDCSDSGRVQGEVLVNGGKLELYSGTITGGVQVGKKGADYQTGSSFTMYGGAITGNEDYGGVFLVGTTNHIDPPSFTMHGGTISDNTAVNYEAEEKDPDSLLWFYRKMVAVRRREDLEETFLYGTLIPEYETVSGVLAYRRKDEKNNILILTTSLADGITLPFTDTIEEVLLNNYDTCEACEETIRLQPYQCLVLKVKE